VRGQLGSETHSRFHSSPRKSGNRHKSHGFPGKCQNANAYNRTSFLAERRKMMSGWADCLDKLRANVKVIPFKQAEGA